MPITQTSLKSKNYNALGIDEIADDISNIITVVNAIPESPTTAIVNISSAQILAMGTTPVVLLPAPGVGMYYDIDKIVLECDFNTTPYTLSDGNIIYFACGDETGIILAAFLKQSYDATGIVRMGSSLDIDKSVLVYRNNQTNTELSMGTWLGGDPTLGDGTIRAIITHTVRTFGA